MERRSRTLGFAKRIRVDVPFGSPEEAWDCRPFGMGRIIAPAMPCEIDLAPGIALDLSSGEVRETSAAPRSAARAMTGRNGAGDAALSSAR